MYKWNYSQCSLRAYRSIEKFWDNVRKDLKDIYEYLYREVGFKKRDGFLRVGWGTSCYTVENCVFTC